ncbi:type II secretion system F family protein [Brevibacillus composti]|uniref:Type II secretion system F family protein n=1 Tax=Brevibacillus composti TaxID=2796470 RepID=A0A7T5ELJ6_9BACL|nr:type II secretion system F family protein [Brevibacillus composti]QQE74757.1 type II secretion system F family protein [Brevibacillus composti]QUO41842.1 type II secretion system F family protein [Brevibacillus composti]
MPMLIASLSFVLVVLVLMPTRWIHVQKVKKGFVFMSSYVASTTRKAGPVQLITPFAMSLLATLRIRIRPKQRKDIQVKLIHAGLSENWTVENFVSVQVACALLAALYFLFLGWASGQPDYYLLALAVGPLGYLLPQQWLKSRIKRRQESIRRELPHLLNAVAIMCEAGLHLFPALREVSTRQKGVLAQELLIVASDVSYGVGQIEALEKMADRCQVEEVSRFVSALSQTIERGAGGITAVLRQQASEVWEDRKKKAQKLGAEASLKLFLPLLLLAFPAMTIFILGPVFIELFRFVLN